MACKLGLQDVSYDPDLHTGEVDFDFFDSVDSALKESHINNTAGAQSSAVRGTAADGDASKSVKVQILACGKNNANAKSEEDSQTELFENRKPKMSSESGEQDSAADTESESEYGSSQSAASADASADHQSDSAPCSPGTERLRTVVRDVTAIQESLHQLRLSAGTSRETRRDTESDPVPKVPSVTSPSRSPVPVSSRGLAGRSNATSCRPLSPDRVSPDRVPAVPPGGGSGPVRARRPRPRSGWPQRKRWNCSLTEAALTQRRIEQLLGAETDSSGSDRAAASDSDAGAAGSADVETWLGAAGSGSDRSQRTRRSPAAAGSGRSAPGGRLGLLAEAVRHLERTKLRTAPPPPRRPVRPPHRKNMSFTNEEVREIDRNNRILLNKIVAQQRRPPARPSPVLGGGKSRGTQDQIRRENMILLRKIRTARPSRSVISGFHETPPPVRPILERGAVRHRQPWNDR